jgi:hypothetical protein
MSSEYPAPRRWSVKAKLLTGIGLVLLILVGVPLTVDSIGRARLGAAIREARATGEPLTFDEIAARRKKWSAAEDAGLVFLPLRPRLGELNAELKSQDLPMVGEAESPPLGHRWTDETHQKVDDQLLAVQDELAKLRALGKYPGGSLPFMPAPNPIDTLLPELADVRFAAKLISLDAIHRAMEGHTDGLSERVAASLRVGQLLQDHPTLISSLVRIAVDSFTVSTIERVLSLSELTPEQLSDLQQQLADIESEDPLYWGLLGERATFYGTGQYLTKTGNTGPLGVTAASRVPGLRGVLFMDQAAGLRMYNRLIAVARQPDQRLDVAAALEQEMSRLSKAYLFTSIMFPALKRSTELGLRRMAQVRAAQVGIAAERYRLKTGQFPVDLGQLVPGYINEVPADPFDEQPLRYKVEGDQRIIYSIGEDEQDDGGDVDTGWKRPPGQQPKDWGFTLFVPQARNRPATQPADTPETQPELLSAGSGGW